MRPLRVGCVPYLNGKPLVDWFHSGECDCEAEVTYAVPSALARQLRDGALDVALVSIFELFTNPGLQVIPDISISADGPVKSVRLFSHVPFERIRSVALDSSSLTSCALVRVLLSELYGVSPEYVSHPPDLDEMLARCDAGLLIGDLKLFDTPARYILDLGEGWKRLAGLPFTYAAWLARADAPTREITRSLMRARLWGESRLEELSVTWAARMRLPLDRVRDYFLNVMRYDLDADKWEAIRTFQCRCLHHGLVRSELPLREAIPV